MRKSLVSFAPLALCAFVGSAFADESGLTLYGILDAAVGHVMHQYNQDDNASAGVNPVSATAAHNAVTGLFNGGIQTSRWGLKGQEDITQSLKAKFQLEDSINLGSGAIVNQAQSLANNVGKTTNSITGSSLDGQIFNRQAWLGLSETTWGSITAGRQYNLFYDIYAQYDPVQFASLFSPLGFSGGLGGGGGVSENLRQNNTLRYSNIFNGVNVSAQYKFGGAPGSTTEFSAVELRAGYEAQSFGVQLAYQHGTDVVSGAASGTAGTVNLTEQNLRAWLITARYAALENLNLKAGYQRYTLSTGSDLLTAAQAFAGSVYASTGVTAGTISQIGAEQNVGIIDVGGDYNLTKNLNLALGYYQAIYDGWQTATGNGASVAGAPGKNIEYVSGLLDYRLSKRTDTYLGWLHTTPRGIAYKADNANNAYGVGLRHVF